MSMSTSNYKTFDFNSINEQDLIKYNCTILKKRLYKESNTL